MVSLDFSENIFPRQTKVQENYGKCFKSVENWKNTPNFKENNANVLTMSWLINLKNNLKTYCWKYSKNYNESLKKS